MQSSSKHSKAGRACVSRSVVPDSLQPHGLQPARLLCPGNSPGKDTGVGCHSLLQGVFPTHGWNPGLLECPRILYCLSHEGSLSGLVHLRSPLWTFSSIGTTSVQFSSVTQSCPTLCDPMNGSMPGLPVHHHFPEFTQTHSDSCPQSLPASESFPMSQLFA